ncbi:MAG: HPr family phosphocarrier protein [Acidobacteria bacterium]|nr:HPr family phosphocarrier protein [Acidobacteriota bacterium]
MASRAVTICNPLGLHARAAARFVHMASRFSSRISVARAGRQVDGKSILGVLLLAAASGATITIVAEGADADTALDELAALVSSGFGELS